MWSLGGYAVELSRLNARRGEFPQLLEWALFFLISHDRRRLIHFDVTAHPTAAWVWRQMIEATP
jgi:hypothetical protein